MKRCETCDEKLSKRPKEAYWQFEKRRYCGRRCAGIGGNPKLPNTEFKSRYRKVKTPDGRNIMEHRWVMEQVIGRPLKTWEQVHHINHDRLDNHPDNLELVTSSEHGKRHTWHPVTKECENCGATFTPHKTKRARAKSCSPVCAQALRRKRTSHVEAVA